MKAERGDLKWNTQLVCVTSILLRDSSVCGPLGVGTRRAGWWGVEGGGTVRAFQKAMNSLLVVKETTAV